MTFSATNRLQRAELAKALTAHGYPIKAGYLEQLAHSGKGPPFRKFGRTPLYDWGDALAWAERRLSAPRHSTSEPASQIAA